ARPARPGRPRRRRPGLQLRLGPGPGRPAGRGGGVGGPGRRSRAPGLLPARSRRRRLAAGFGNLAEAIRQAVALSLQVASEVPRVVAENDEMVRQSQAQVDALATVEAATRD